MQSLKFIVALTLCVATESAAAPKAAQADPDIRTGPSAPGRAHGGVISALAISPDGRLLASSSGDELNTIKIWSLPDGRLLRTLAGTPGAVLSFSNGGLSTAEGLGHSDLVNFVTFSSVGGLLASGSVDNTVKIWSLADGRVLSTLKGTRIRNVRRDERIRGLAFTPDGRQLVYTDEFGVHVRTARGERLVAEQNTGWVYPLLAVSRDGKWVATACTSCYPESQSQKLALWSLPALKRIAEVNPQSNKTEALSFAPDGKWLITAGDGAIRLWTTPGLLFDRKVDEKSAVYGLTISPKADRLAVAIRRGSEGGAVVKMWSLPDLQPVTHLKMPKDFESATDVVFAAAGGRLIVAGMNGHIATWDRTTGEFGPYLLDPAVK